MAQYKAIVTNCSIITGRETITVSPSVIGSMQIIHDYESRRCPVFQITLGLPNEVISKIFSDPTSKMKLEMVEQAYNGTDKGIRNALINKTFDIIPQDEKSTFRIQTKPTINNNTVEDVENTVNISLYLLDKGTIKNTQKASPFNLKDATMATAISYMLSSRGFGSGTVVATPPVNSKVYPNLNVDIKDLYKSIKYLNDIYGVYNSDFIFYASEYMYILDKSNPNVILEEAGQFGNIIIQILNSTNLDSAKVGSYEDANSKTHVINIPKIPIFQDYVDNIHMVTHGNIAHYNNSSGKLQTDKLSSDAKTLYLTGVNELAATQAKNRISAAKQKTTVTVEGCSMNIFRPYKDVKFNMGDEYTAYRNLNAFRLVGVTHSLIKDGNNEFRVSTIIDVATR